MKQILLIVGCFIVSPIISFGQIDLMSLNEDANARESRVKSIKEFREKEKSEPMILEPEGSQKEKEPDKIQLPLLSFGSNFLAGSETVGFRPTVLANTQLAKNSFGFGASIQATTPDNQQFDQGRTGQSLLINELSNASFNIGFGYGIPSGNKYPLIVNSVVQTDDAGDTILKEYSPRVGFFANMHLRNNSLFDIDSTNGSVKSDIQTFAASLGVECIIFRGYLSTYVGVNYISVVNSRDNYKSYFTNDPKYDLFNIRGGFRVKFLEGDDGFKGIYADASVMTITGDMKPLVGNNVSALFILQLGYQKKIAVGQKKFEKAEEKLNEIKRQDKINKAVDDRFKKEMDRLNKLSQ